MRYEKPLREMTFTELVLLLHEELTFSGIDHAFSGGLALAWHVRNPRATNDMDLSVSAGNQSVADVFMALPAGVKWNRRSVRLAEVIGSVKLRWVRDIPVDLFFPVDDYHEIVLGRAEPHRFSGEVMKFVTATDLTVLKTTFHRGNDVSSKQRDWLDVRSMLEAGSVDTDEAEHWIARIAGEGSPELEQFVNLVLEVEASPPPVPNAEADGYRLPTIQKGVPPVSRQRQPGSVCGHWMPRARRACSRPLGHPGRHQ